MEHSGEDVDKKDKSYTLNALKRKKELILSESEKSKLLFNRYLEFYNENYPKTAHGITWDQEKIKEFNGIEGDFKKTIEDAPDITLIDAHSILLYSRRELEIKDMKEVAIYDKTRYLITKRLPKEIREGLEGLENLKLAEYNEFIKKSDMDNISKRILEREAKQELIDQEIKRLSKVEYFCPVCNSSNIKLVKITDFKCQNIVCQSKGCEISFKRVKTWTEQYKHYVGVNNGTIQSYKCPECESPLRSDDYLYVSDILMSLSEIQKLDKKTMSQRNRLINKKYPKPNEIYCEMCRKPFLRAEFELKEKIDALKTIEINKTVEPIIPIEPKK